MPTKPKVSTAAAIVFALAGWAYVYLAAYPGFEASGVASGGGGGVLMKTAGADDGIAGSNMGESQEHGNINTVQSDLGANPRPSPLFLAGTGLLLLAVLLRRRRS